MGPTRFPYGTALGFTNNFNYRGTTANLINADTTPDVTIGNLFYVQNASPSTITYFDLQDFSNRSANYEGKIITLFFLDANTTIANSDQIFMASTSNNFLTNQSVSLMHSRSGWYEIDRSLVTRNDQQAYSIAGTQSINVDGTRVAVIMATAALTLRSISGGQTAQNVILVNNSAGNTVTIDTAGNIVIAGTNALVMRAGDRFDITRVGASWFLGRTV